MRPNQEEKTSFMNTISLQFKNEQLEGEVEIHFDEENFDSFTQLFYFLRSFSMEISVETNLSSTCSQVTIIKISVPQRNGPMVHPRVGDIHFLPGHFRHLSYARHATVKEPFIKNENSFKTKKNALTSV